MKTTCILAVLGLMVAGVKSASPVIPTTDGRVSGTVVNGVETYLGIPYGADTSGANRFQPPKPVARWSDVRPATHMGPRCPQLTHRMAVPLLAFSDDPTSEDCLVLNVWTPSRAAARRAKRPVMVWIHGGGYGFGAANDPLYDGAGLARNQGVVLVSLNHRLNALGYLNLGEGGGAANVGQLDIVQALRWVKANIARFGGDPDNVTLFGQSGGGAKISLLLAMPAARGLFHKAIVESGSVITEQSPEQALAWRDKLLGKLGLKPSEAAKLRDVPIADLTAAVDTLGVLNFKPWIDGAVLPRQPFAPDAAATARGIPLMVGTAADEATAILVANPAWPAMTEAMVRGAIVPLVGAANVDHALALYKARRPADGPPQLYASIFTDFGFTHKAQQLAARQAANGSGGVWAFRTDWRSPVLGGALRAPHGVELPFVFDTVAKAPGLVGTAPQPAMVAMFQRRFAAFARNGDPAVAGQPTWSRYDARSRQTFVFDTVPHVVADPDPAIRAFWDEIDTTP